ncbi:MAG: tRNA uridine-5-carboxymethylaminomethyl(34) synthesis GTPase MnmE [Spirochaetes bacterium]|uniref:tRNA modification GTPase MnmE n=1 Tax=Candidatus Ornithospirochaeta stercoripullorum TaxID=2840899 RepID=A0A9D9DZC0_9SPIO|nr:tRNA uridine-5-carboxymethylaminomethyl(34) synthesis GTPase MnmE [Candidatus Ornithospirochaeta stercoripullorum]
MANYETGEPIYALATPYSPSALAVIRASGDDVLLLFQPYFTGNLGKARSSLAVHGYIKDENGKRIDEVMVIKYSKGHGYTSEEAFEIMCHGSLAVIREIEKVLVKAGIREALPGEFTYRAFMHGRMDLTEAEAVEEIVKAKTGTASGEALERLSGSIREEAEKAKDAILDILASLEVELDYGEDEIPEDWIFPEEKAEAIRLRLEAIASTFKASRLWSEGALVVIAGRTNAGKSSLYNALLKENRAIVSPVEGTTRDYIETDAILSGIPVRLFDTAGLRETDEVIEKEGIRRSEELIDKADLVIYVIDPSSGDLPPEGKKILPVYSRQDLSPSSSGLSFSSVTGEGIGNVLEAVRERLTEDLDCTQGVPRIDSERQRDKLLEAADALVDAQKSLAFGADVTAMYLQSALTALGELTGSVTGDDVLDRLFSSFCLGK